MDKSVLSGEALLEQGKGAADQVVKTVTTQVTGNTNQAGHKPEGAKAGSLGVVSDIESLKQALYGKSQTHQAQTPHPTAGGGGPATQQKAGEEQQLEQARKKLHMEQHTRTYYEQTFNRQEPPGERHAEKVERQEQEEKQKKMEKLQEEEKKKPPVALQRAQTRAETNRGASG